MVTANGNTIPSANVLTSVSAVTVGNLMLFPVVLNNFVNCSVTSGPTLTPTFVTSNVVTSLNNNFLNYVITNFVTNNIILRLGGLPVPTRLDTLKICFVCPLINALISTNVMV